ncbi:MAG: hypothetical protein FK734_20630 [Asgard group archaeon]|nr:hypothetical protein [Asgard group archaeon]
MSVNATLNSTSTPVKSSGRFATLDLSRGLAIFLMIGLHTLSYALNINDLLADIENLPLVNLIALVILPFYGGLAGFFLLVSATSNTVSIYKNLEKGNSIRSIVAKQVIGGFLLLIFAMLCEALIGYHGAFGNFFKYLNDPAAYFDYNPLLNWEHWGESGFNYNWQTLLYRWNHFETIHTIAWCVIINGCVQGLLSLKNNWQNRKRMIIAYAILAVAVVALTLPVWELVKLMVPGYPFTPIPGTGDAPFTPVIGVDSWWRIVTAPFLSPLAAPMEPIFPYLAISFFGSIIGIVITKPREKISKHFPKTMLLIGLVMFLAGTTGVVIIMINVMNAQGFEAAAGLYQLLPYHRHYSPDYDSAFPLFAWLAQFLCVNGFAIMLIMFLFRMIEFRGKSKLVAERTKIIRRFGTVAFSNYNNQYIYFALFAFISFILKGAAYTKLFWGGTFLTIGVALGVYILLLYFWEKVKYTGSLEWLLRTFNNNVIPVNRKRFDESTKWWQRGQIDTDKQFYNAQWIDLVEPLEQKEQNEEQFLVEQKESKLALILSIIGSVTIIFNIISIFGLFASINARKIEGKNKRNKAAFILSIIGCVLFVAFYVVCFTVKIGVLGIF